MSETFEIQNAQDGLTLRGEVHGVKNPVAVMSLVHGFGEHQGRYAHMVEHLNNNDVAVVTMDLRGHGISEGKRGVCRGYDLLLGDADALLTHTRATFPETPHFLYGHSMGGGLVMNYALKKFPDYLSGVISSAPLILPAAPIPKVLEILIKVLKPVFPNMTIGNPISGDKISTMPEEQARYEADELNHSRLGLGLGHGIIAGGEWILSDAQNWDMPLLLMHAKNDQLTSFSASQTFASEAQNCQFEAFENNIQHEMHNDIERSRVYGLMLNFLKSSH